MDQNVAIKNESQQSFEIYVMTTAGARSYWIQPKESIIVAKESLTEQIRIMQRRNILKITAA